MNPGDDEAQKCRAGDERERHVHGGGAGRDGHYDRRRRNQSTEQAHPSAEEDTAEMKGHQGRADAHDAEKNRAANSAEPGASPKSVKPAIIVQNINGGFSTKTWPLNIGTTQFGPP